LTDIHRFFGQREMAPMYADQFEIYHGNANPDLARKIARYLGVQCGKAEVFQFANENIFVKILDNVREKDVFIVQPTSHPVNQSIMELLIMIDAFKRASAGRITAVIPFYAYGRSDKKDQPRVPITARLIADMITVAGADRVLSMDLHQGQIQGFFNIPVDVLTAVHMLSRYFIDKHLEDCVVVTDLGFAKRARAFAELLDAPLAIIEKRRVGNLDRAELMNVIGDVHGKRVVIVDDEIDTAGTLVEIVRALEREGVTEMYACATHGVLSDPAPSWSSRSSPPSRTVRPQASTTSADTLARSSLGASRSDTRTGRNDDGPLLAATLVDTTWRSRRLAQPISVPACTPRPSAYLLALSPLARHAVTSARHSEALRRARHAHVPLLVFAMTAASHPALLDAFRRRIRGLRRSSGAMPTAAGSAASPASPTTLGSASVRLRRSAFFSLSSGSSVHRCVPRCGSTRSMLDRSQRATRTVARSRVRYADGSS
jgi:ribose-phosphate pyrophosphokinase